MPHFFLPTSTEEIALFYSDGKSLQEHPGTRRRIGRYVSALSAYDQATATWVHIGYDDGRDLGRIQGISRRIEVWESRPESEPTLRQEFLLDPSSTGSIESIALKDNVLFVSGKINGAQLVAIDLETRTQSPVPVEIGGDVGPYRDVFHLAKIEIEGDQLIGVGEFGNPQWLHEVDVSNPRAARFLRTVDLPNHWAAEHVQSIAISGAHLCVASRGQGGDQTSDRILLISRSTLKLVQSWRTIYQTDSGSGYLGRDFNVLRVDLLDESLLECFAEFGVGILDIRALLGDVKAWEVDGLLRNSRRTILKANHSAIRVYFVSATTLLISWQSTTGSVFSELTSCPP